MVLVGYALGVYAFPWFSTCLYGFLVPSPWAPYSVPLVSTHSTVSSSPTSSSPPCASSPPPLSVTPAASFQAQVAPVLPWRRGLFLVLGLLCLS